MGVEGSPAPQVSALAFPSAPNAFPVDLHSYPQHRSGFRPEATSQGTSLATEGPRLCQHWDTLQPLPPSARTSLLRTPWRGPPPAGMLPPQTPLSDPPGALLWAPTVGSPGPCSPATTRGRPTPQEGSAQLVPAGTRVRRWEEGRGKESETPAWPQGAWRDLATAAPSTLTKWMSPAATSWCTR